MEPNSKLIPILMARRYATVKETPLIKETLIVNARDSTMLMKLLGDITPTEIAMFMVTIYTKSTRQSTSLYSSSQRNRQMAGDI